MRQDYVIYQPNTGEILCHLICTFEKGNNPTLGKYSLAIKEASYKEGMLVDIASKTLKEAEMKKKKSISFPPLIFAGLFVIDMVILWAGYLIQAG